MVTCPECQGPAHIPEECPAATWYAGPPTGGACEDWFIRHTPEGREIAADVPWGTEDYYQAVMDGTDMMHAAGGCPL